MKVIVYLDIVILSTVVVNYALIKSILLIYHEKVNYLRLSLGLLVSVLALGLYIIPWPWLFNLRYFIGFIIGIISFPFTSIKDMIIKIVVFYLLNLAFIGTLVIFDIHNYFVMFIALIYIIIMWIVENYHHIEIKNKGYLYNVSIEGATLRGYLDSGNEVYYEGLPVVFIKSCYLDNKYQIIGTLMIETMIGNNEVIIYKGPLLTIYKKKIPHKFIVYYVFKNEIKYDVVLNKEIIGGVE